MDQLRHPCDYVFPLSLDLVWFEESIEKLHHNVADLPVLHLLCARQHHPLCAPRHGDDSASAVGLAPVLLSHYNGVPLHFQAALGSSLYQRQEGKNRSRCKSKVKEHLCRQEQEGA